MNKSKFIAIVGILFVLGIAIFYKFVKQSEPQTEVHYHAGFVVFDNGKKVDFSDLKYMNIEPCTLHKEDEEETPEHNQLEKAHLHDMIPDVVHSHRENAKWGDLFTNIKYSIVYSKVTAFINGNEVLDIQSTPIKAYDSVVIFINTVDKNLITQAITVDHIKEVENKSENCGN